MAGGVGTPVVVQAGHALTERGIAIWPAAVGAVPRGRTRRAGSVRDVAGLVVGTRRDRQTGLETTTGVRLTGVSGTAVFGDAALDTAMKGNITTRAIDARAVLV